MKEKNDNFKLGTVFLLLINAYMSANENDKLNIVYNLT
jgi:hypothetical protein